MATGRDASAEVAQALHLGANDYVTKPLDFPVVLARVQTQLALKRQSERVLQLEAHIRATAGTLITSIFIIVAAYVCVLTVVAS